MQIGRVVDFCIEYNNRQARAEREAEKAKKPKKRKASQGEINAFFG